MKLSRKQTMDILQNIAAATQEFYDKPIKGNREKLAELVKKIENGGFGLRLHREGYKDKNQGSAVKFYVYDQCMNNDMSPDIEIFVSNETIIIQNDVIWKTIYGIKEQLEEESAYEYKTNRWGT